MENVPDMLYSSLQFETSTIFLNTRKWIFKYLKFVEANKEKMNSKSTLTSIIKCLNPVNELLFVSTFIYYRIYKFGYLVMFNSDTYVKLFDGNRFGYINRFIILLIYTLYFLNIYWLGLMVKKFTKITCNLFKHNTDLDPELSLIEKLKTQILSARSDLVN
jgi:hypothetical protein